MQPSHNRGYLFRWGHEINGSVVIIIFLDEAERELVVDQQIVYKNNQTEGNKIKKIIYSVHNKEIARWTASCCLITTIRTKTIQKRQFHSKPEEKWLHPQMLRLNTLSQLPVVHYKCTYVNDLLHILITYSQSRLLIP